MANILTSIRILCGVLLLRFPAFSGAFCALYLLGGLTDALDGAAARRLGTETPFGAKFDTAADFVFAAAALVRIVPAAALPAWLLAWICAIFAVRVLSAAVGLVRYRRLVTVHSALNRACGVAVFLSPVFLGAFAWQGRTAAAVFVCLLAGIAAADESRKILRGEAVS